MKSVVADASFCGAWILPDEASPHAELVLEEILNGGTHLIVPALWHYELLNLMRSAYRRERLDESTLWAAQEALSQVPLKQTDVPDETACKGVLNLALKHNLSAYDASYLELALRLKVTLHTTDRDLRVAAGKEGIGQE